MTLYRFTVSARLKHDPLPVDMLRYDSCWPASGEDANKLSDAVQIRREVHPISVTLCSHSKPTIARWASFLWSVTNIQTLRG